MAPQRWTVEELFDRWTAIIPGVDCHIWMGKTGTGGYGYLSYRKGNKRLCRKAATIALELAGRPRPERMEVNHTCFNRWCVNPAHLKWDTHSQNLKDRRPFPRYKDHLCKKGHPLDGVKLAANGGCPVCEKTRLAAWREKNPTANRDYYAANRERINALRRARRSKSKI